jgi:hypothetical protein
MWAVPTLNLDSAQNRGLTVNNQEFSPKLDETWQRRSNVALEGLQITLLAGAAKGTRLFVAPHLPLPANGLAVNQCVQPGMSYRL